MKERRNQVQEPRQVWQEKMRTDRAMIRVTLINHHRAPLPGPFHFGETYMRRSIYAEYTWDISLLTDNRVVTYQAYCIYIIYICCVVCYVFLKGSTDKNTFMGKNPGYIDW